MRLARRVAAGLVLGALVGFLAALLRPRSALHTATASLAVQPAIPESTGPESAGPEFRSGDALRQTVLTPQPVIGGTA